MNYFLVYLLIVNVVGFLLMYIDKNRARKKQWRIQEKTYFITALIGGALGVWMGMYSFRHKTKHIKFTLGIPAILILELALVYFYFR